MTRSASLAAPLVQPCNNPGAPVFIVIADDAGGPFPRIGEVTKRGPRTWEAWPMGAEMRTNFATKREAVRFVCDVARDGYSPATPAVGRTVRALFPNSKWGTGEVIEVREDPSLKPYVVRRADGTVGSFHAGQIAVAA